MLNALAAQAPRFDWQLSEGAERGEVGGEKEKGVKRGASEGR
jgi:hypothetical protein